MIPAPTGVRVWLAVGRTDMSQGMNGLALQVQETLGRDPHAGDLFVFRGRAGDQIQIIWHDGLGMSLYAKRLERGRQLLDQLELQLEGLEATAAEDEVATAAAAAQGRPAGHRGQTRLFAPVLTTTHQAGKR